MNEIKVFENSQFGQVRTIAENDKILFCAKDVAVSLGYADSVNAIKRHCRGVAKRHLIDNMGREQEMSFIPEGDVYRLIARSKLPAAEQFERWVFDEVLPSIRKTGGYIAGEESMTDEELLSKALLVMRQKLEQREARIQSLAVENNRLTVENQIMSPKAQYFNELVDRNLLTNFRETAKELKIKERAFVGFLLDRKYVYRDKKGKLMPYEAKNDGLFEIKECFNDKTAWSGTQTLITPKGRETFRLLMQGI